MTKPELIIFSLFVFMAMIFLGAAVIGLLANDWQNIKAMKEDIFKKKEKLPTDEELSRMMK